MKFVLNLLRLGYLYIYPGNTVKYRPNQEVCRRGRIRRETEDEAGSGPYVQFIKMDKNLIEMQK